jgi:flagellar biogenesis protein FliO
MKALLRLLTLAALLLTPAFGKAKANPAQTPRASQSNDTSIALRKTNANPAQAPRAGQDNDASIALAKTTANPVQAPWANPDNDISMTSGETSAIPDQAPPANQGNDTAIVEPADHVLPVEKAEEPASNYPMFRAVGGLGLVTFLMIAAYFTVKKLAPRFFAKGSSERNLKIIETLSMGDKKSISMIQMGNSRFLVGNTAHQISLLMALPDSVSLISESETESETVPEIYSSSLKKESSIPFKKLFEVEKKRPVQNTAHPLPEDIRTKMRQLREALER